MNVIANGKKFTFPDGTDPEVVSDAIDEYFSTSSYETTITPEIEAQYPHPPEPKKQKYMGRGGSEMANIQNRAIWSRTKDEIDKLRELAATNPEQATLIAGMTQGEKMLTGIGAGMSDVARGAKNLLPFLPYDQLQDPTGIAELERVSEAAGGGRIIGQAAPFLPAGIGVSSIPSLTGRIVGSSLVGGAEGATVASGTGQDPVRGALVGAAIGGGAEVVGAVLNRLGGALIRKYFNKEVPALDQSGNPTPELSAALEKEGMTFDDLTKLADAESATKEVATAATAPTERNIADIASKIEINPERQAAAQRMGVDSPLSTMTDQSQIHEIVGAASAVPGSKTSEALVNYSKELTKKAEQTVEEFSGYLDKEVVSENLKSKMQSQIKELGSASDDIYKAIGEAVPQTTIVNARPLLADLNKRASAREKGINALSAVERDVYNTLKGKPTYADVDALRKKIGSSIGNIKGHYINEEEATLNRLYSQLSQVQEGVADQIGGGAGQLWKEVKELDKKRFAMQKNSEFLFGKDNIGTVMPKLESSLQALAKGNNEPFKKIIGAIPEEQKGSVISSAIDSVIRKSYAGDVRLDANGFAKWYNQLSRSATNKKTLMSQLPEGAEKRLDDLYLLSQGLANVNNNRVRTGAINTIFKKFDDADGIVARLYGLADKVSESPVVGSIAGPTARVVANTAKMATKERTPAIVAADELLASPEFRTAVLSMAEPAKKRAVAMRKLENTEAYKNYIGKQNKSRVASISAVGLIPFLAGEEEEQ